MFLNHLFTAVTSESSSSTSDLLSRGGFVLIIVASSFSICTVALVALFVL